MSDGLEVDVSAMNRLAADLTKAAFTAQMKTPRVVAKAGYDTEAIAKQFCPVDTGFLRSSIGTEVTRAGAETRAVVAPTASYAEFVEFGASRQAPAAFMGPAFDRVAPGFVGAIEKLGGELL